jgi:hypothetical protein
MIHQGRGGGAYVLFPYDVAQEFGSTRAIPVKGAIDGEAYRGSLMKYGQPQHLLGVEKAIRTKIGKGPGDRVTVELVRDTEPRIVAVPPDLAKAIAKAKLSSFFDTLSYTHREEYCRWITEAKKEETRARRVTKAVEMLNDGVKTPD